MILDFLHDTDGERRIDLLDELRLPVVKFNGVAVLRLDSHANRARLNDRALG